MVDFTNLNQYKVTKDNVKEYKLVELAGEPSIMLRSATEGNAGYMNGLLRATGQAAGDRRVKQSNLIDSDLMDKTRERDKLLFPEHVFVGWEGILDAEGKEVKFSVKVAKEFVQALPDWIFDPIRIYANTPSNFLDEIDAAGKSKNLPKG